MELLSLTSDNDLVLAKIDDYYLCLAEPSKRRYKFNWRKAKNYCKSLDKDYSLPSIDELNLIYTNKGDFSLGEICLYSNETNTLDFISIWPDIINRHKFYPWVWSSDKNLDESFNYIFLQCFNNGIQVIDDDISFVDSWTLPVRRIKC